MTKILIDTEVFTLEDFRNEEELEKMVSSNKSTIFGDDAIYVPQKSIETSGGKATIPDGVVLDYSNERWFIIEFELEKNGYNHIVTQITRHINAAENLKTKKKLVRIFLDMIYESQEQIKRFEERGIPSIKIQSVLEKIIDKPPIVMMIIDRMNTDLKDFCKRLQIYWIEVNKFLTKGGGKKAYLVPPLPFVAPPQPKKLAEEKKAITEEQFLSQCDTPGKILYNGLKKLAEEMNDKFLPITQAFSYYIALPKGNEFCPLTLWPKGLTINKMYIEKQAYQKIIPEKAVSNFREGVLKISALSSRYDVFKQPGFSTREGDVSESDIELFISTFRKLVESIKKA